MQRSFTPTELTSDREDREEDPRLSTKWRSERVGCLSRHVAFSTSSQGTLVNTGDQVYSGTIAGSDPVMIHDDQFRFYRDLLRLEKRAVRPTCSTTYPGTEGQMLPSTSSAPA